MVLKYKPQSSIKWSVLVGFGRFWPVLAGFGRFWLVLAGLGQLWPVLASDGPLCAGPRLAMTGPATRRGLQGPLGPSWGPMVGAEEMWSQDKWFQENQVLKKVDQKYSFLKQPG